MTGEDEPDLDVEPLLIREGVEPMLARCRNPQRSCRRAARAARTESVSSLTTNRACAPGDSARTSPRARTTCFRRTSRLTSEPTTAGNAPGHREELFHPRLIDPFSPHALLLRHRPVSCPSGLRSVSTATLRLAELPERTGSPRLRHSPRRGAHNHATNVHENVLVGTPGREDKPLLHAYSTPQDPPASAEAVGATGRSGSPIR